MSTMGLSVIYGRETDRMLPIRQFPPWNQRTSSTHKLVKGSIQNGVLVRAAHQKATSSAKLSE